MEFLSSFDPNTKTWLGPERNSIYHPDVSIGDIMINVFRRDPKKIIQINQSTGRSLTCSEVMKLSITMATNFILGGLKQDEDIIGIISTNTDLLLSVVYAAFIAGLPINPLDPLFTTKEIIHMFGQTKPSIIFCDKSCYERVKEAVGQMNLNSPIYILNGIIDDKERNIKELFVTNTANKSLLNFNTPKLINGGNQTAAIVCTSGTTGPPKGVHISHRLFILTASSSLFTRDDNILCFSSIYWLSGISFLIVAALTGCCRIITGERFSTNLAINLIKEYSVTVLFFPPTSISALVQIEDLDTNDLSTVNIVMIGGDFCSPHFIEKFRKLLKNDAYILNVYGITEATSVVTANLFSIKPESIGKPYYGIQIKIIDENTNKALDSNKIGEICIKTGLKWKGYYNNDNMTKQIYDENEFIHTGDLGYFDNDGYFYITGRSKQIFKYNNYQINPVEIEELIAQMPGVIDVSVVELYDENIGTTNIAAAVVKQQNSKLTTEFIEDYVSVNVSDIKKIRGGVYFFDSLPMTPSDKVIKEKVIEMIKNMNAKL